MQSDPICARQLTIAELGLGPSAAIILEEGLKIEAGHRARRGSGALPPTKTPP
jgi:hypothetical protein